MIAATAPVVHSASGMTSLMTAGRPAVLLVTSQRARRAHRESSSSKQRHHRPVVRILLDSLSSRRRLLPLTACIFSAPPSVHHYITVLETGGGEEDVAGSVIIDSLTDDQPFAQTFGRRKQHHKLIAVPHSLIQRRQVTLQWKASGTFMERLLGLSPAQQITIQKLTFHYISHLDDG